MKKFIESKTMFNTHRFEVVEKIPSGFFVWNIGDNMVDGYIPIAESVRPGDRSCYEIRRETLKAIALDPAAIKILRDAANWGITSVKAANRALKRQPKSYNTRRQKELAEAALPILESITE